MTTTTTTATYTKLNDGSWGIRVSGPVKVGDFLTVSKRDGSAKQETVKAVLWTKDSVSLCSVVPTQRPVSQQKPSGGRRCRPGQMCPRCDSEPLNGNLHCWECGFTG